MVNLCVQEEWFRQIVGGPTRAAPDPRLRRSVVSRLFAVVGGLVQSGGRVNPARAGELRRYAFGIRFNPLFMIYIALLGCSTYALIGGLVTTDWAGIKASFTERTPVREVSIFLVVIAGLFYLLWLSEAIPASLTGIPPQSVKDDGTPTNVIHVLDMAWLLPALVITAVSLWRKQSMGYALAAALLTNLVFPALAILSMIVFQGQGGEPVAIPEAVIFVALFAVSIGMLVGHLKNLKRRSAGTACC